MEYTIRTIRKSEYPLLEDFLYEAIFVPPGADPPPRSILQSPELQVYVRGFGGSESDLGLVAQADGAVVGAVWARIMDDYGHVDDQTPSLAISLYRAYRGAGIGTGLLRAMIGLLRENGCAQVSLAVQKENYAVGMYRRAGFQVVRETDEEYIMVKELR